jgi:PAS domain S-box-containing protein
MTGCTSKRPYSKAKFLKIDNELADQNERLLKGIETRQDNLNTLSKYLSELESQLSLIFAASPDIIVFLDKNSNIVKISDAACTILGYSKEELKDKQLWQFIASEDLEATKKQFEEIQKNKVFYFEGNRAFVNHWISKDGRRIKLVWRFSICDDREQQTIGIATDITHFGTNDVYNFKLLQKAVESSSDGISIIDAQRENCPIVYVNKAFESITGYTKEEAVGKSCRFLETEETRESRAVKVLCHNLKVGQTTDVLLQCLKRDGSVFYNHLIVSPVLESGQIINYISILRDVTNDIGIDYEWSPNAERGFAPAPQNSI